MEAGKAGPSDESYEMFRGCSNIANGMTLWNILLETYNSYMTKHVLIYLYHLTMRS